MEINTACILGPCCENRLLEWQGIRLSGQLRVTPRVSGWCHLSGVNAEPMAARNLGGHKGYA